MMFDLHNLPMNEVGVGQDAVGQGPGGQGTTHSSPCRCGRATRRSGAYLFPETHDTGQYQIGMVHYTANDVSPTGCILRSSRAPGSRMETLLTCAQEQTNESCNRCP